MCQQTDPSYLRYIYDGLEKGTIHSDNASELPDGFIGIYEAAFDEGQNSKKRQQTLEQFALWALLEKEVSSNFVAEVLGGDTTAEDILNFISTYSKWFNSPEPGKYQLYHERLRVFLLQKHSGNETQEIHEKLIIRLEKAIEEKKADEFEHYALQYLSHHLMVEAFESINGKRLLEFTKSESTWDRQIQISNKFDWSKQGLKNSAQWTAKHNQEENILCYLDLVKLHHKEQNDAESIIQLVANNEIELALDRIKAFGGKSKEENERQFILFMLCLMELTLLDSKNKPWTKNAIKRLLDNIEYVLPENFNLIDPASTLSILLIFKISFSIFELNLKSSVIYKKIKNIENDSFGDYLFSTNEIQHLLEINNYLNISSIIIKAIIQIKDLDCALTNLVNLKEKFLSSSDKAIFYCENALIISESLFAIRKQEKAISIIRDLISNRYPFLIKIDDIRDKVIYDIILCLVTIKDIPQAIEYSNKINNERIWIKSVFNVIIYYNKMGEISKAKKLCSQIYKKSNLNSEELACDFLIPELLRFNLAEICIDISKSIKNHYCPTKI